MTKGKGKDDKLYSSHKDNPDYDTKVFVNYKLNAYCITCNMEYPKPMLTCPICHHSLRQHSKTYQSEI